MADEPTMRDKIMRAAEQRVRASGFAEMSFRDVAADVGVKSASVHYHFPTKADLGVAIVAAYSKRFSEALAQIDPSDLQAAFDAYAALYDVALVLDEAICLCAIMSAESIGLPPLVNDQTRAFFQMNLTWLEGLFGRHGLGPQPGLARLVVTALEGAIIVASNAQDRTVLADVTQELRQLVLRRLAILPVKG
jgi:TetR/AcrR family transcriptional repressor of nem operon